MSAIDFRNPNFVWMATSVLGFIMAISALISSRITLNEIQGDKYLLKTIKYASRMTLSISILILVPSCYMSMYYLSENFNEVRITIMNFTMPDLIWIVGSVLTSIAIALAFTMAFISTFRFATKIISYIETFIGVCVGLLVFILIPILIIYFIIKFENIILYYTSHRMFIIPAIFIGIIFFRLRSKHPLLYGLIEIIVSVVTIWFSIVAQSDSFLSKSIGILGGIYIMVRGLTNIDDGLPSTLRPIWDRWFPKKKKDGREVSQYSTPCPPAPETPPSPRA
jgi:hypothetical protein